MNRVITPTVGRKVWLRAPKGATCNGARLAIHDDKQPLDATVVYVWGDRMVNLHVIDHAGVGWALPSVTLCQPDDTPQDDVYCEWMPYQVGAAKAAA